MDWVYNCKYIAFSGGGVRGLAFIGAWRALGSAFKRRQLELYQQLQGFAGTSAGSMIALLASLGCSDVEMMEECAVMDGIDIIKTIDLVNVTDQWGLHDKKQVIYRLREILAKYADNADITFGDLHKKTNKHLVVTVTRVNDGKALFYSHETAFELEVWRGVAASMSIPILFTPNRINDEILVDGGLLVNLPMDVFPLEQTIAFLLTKTPPFRVTRFTDYLLRVIYIALEALEKQRLESIPLNLRDHIISIDTGTFSSVEFTLTEEQRQSLVKMGWTRVAQVLLPNIDDLVKSARHAVLQSLICSSSRLLPLRDHPREVDSPLVNARCSGICATPPTGEEEYNA